MFTEKKATTLKFLEGSPPWLANINCASKKNENHYKGPADTMETEAEATPIDGQSPLVFNVSHQCIATSHSSA